MVCPVLDHLLTSRVVSTGTGIGVDRAFEVACAGRTYADFESFLSPTESEIKPSQAKTLILNRRRDPRCGSHGSGTAEFRSVSANRHSCRQRFVHRTLGTLTLITWLWLRKVFSCLFTALFPCLHTNRSTEPEERRQLSCHGS